MRVHLRMSQEQGSVQVSNSSNEKTILDTMQQTQQQSKRIIRQEELKPKATKTLDSKECLSSEEKLRPRQVIAVSASRGPAAFFNLARKFLVTDEMCDLSALEGAIVSAVDAAHLLERSKLATIVRVQTSYVTVEPKRRKQHAQPSTGSANGSDVQQQKTTIEMPSESTGVDPPPVPLKQGAPVVPDRNSSSKSGSSSKSSLSSGGRELRRARIVITVKRTESYKQWLLENPLQAIIAGDGDDDPSSDSGVQNDSAEG